jgi:hypothetical protein
MEVSGQLHAPAALLPEEVFMAWCLVKHRGNLFYVYSIKLLRHFIKLRKRRTKKKKKKRRRRRRSLYRCGRETDDY